MATPRFEDDRDIGSRARRRWRGGICASALAASALSACTGPPEDLSAPGRHEVPLTGMVQLVAAIDRGATRAASTVDVPVVAGEAGIEVGTDGRGLAIDRLELALGDVEVPEAIMPGGIRLTGLHVALAAPAVTDDGAARVGVSLDWAIEIDGKTWPLARQRLDGLALDAAIGGDGDALAFHALVRGDGVRWTWADIVTFADVAIDVRGET